MQKIYNLFSSFVLMAILLAIFAAGSGVATFIENDFGAQTAKALVYNALWFEAVMVLLAINISAIIYKTKMWNKPTVLLIHLSFLVILLGSVLTHFVGFEGVMHLRNGDSSNKISSSDTYLTVKEANQTVSLPISINPILSSSYSKSVDLNGNKLDIKLKEFVTNAIKTVMPDANGSAVVNIMIANETDKPEQHIIDSNSSVNSFGLTFGFNADSNIKFSVADDKIFVSSDKKIKIANLADDTVVELAPKEQAELSRGKLYTVNGIRFVPKAVYSHGKVSVASQGIKGGESALVLDVNGKELTVFGSSGEVGKFYDVVLDGKKFGLSYGAKEIALPFSLTLDRFELLRYPGSMSPSSYSSYVKVNGKDSSFDYHIYMNHVLDYDGFRFFQSSYDMDEQGTILSVSSDPGKIPTYIGYLMLCIGIFASFFNPKGRLWSLGKKLIAPAIALFFVFASQNSYAEDNATDKINSIFGQILTQDNGGRIKPMESLAIDVVDKISGQNSVNGKNAAGVLFSMMTYPKDWENSELIKVNHPKVKELLGMSDGQKKATFSSAFTNDGGYKLAEAVEEANRKPQSKRDTFDKEVLKVDERFNVCMMVFTGQFLKIFPKPNDPNNAWLDPQNALTTLPKDYADRALNALQELFAAAESENVEKATEAANAIKDLQVEYGASVLPPEDKVKAEIFYNKAELFKRLIFVYLFAGLVLFFAQLSLNERSSQLLNRVSLGAFVVIVIAFIVHTFALGLRWYISGHAPWSDGYESMIYISWAASLAGLIFYRFLPLALAMTALLAASTLMTAHIGFVDPQITNIVPVLKSYWLNIHVSLITASYGFLGLGFFLGLLNLGLFAFRNSAKPNRDEMIKKATIVNEMTLIVGLGLLTIGNFLGGVWANESWGRYWGWDPKETWALVSILVYTLVVHYRFIPGLKSIFALNAMSVFAFASILMTYFGVNYYLSGLHSYASGDPVPVPWFVWAGLIFVMLLFFASIKKRDLK